MLKKAGIVVAAAAAGLLAVSPLAFAGEAGAHGHGHGHGHGHEVAGASASYDHSPSCDFDAKNDNSASQGALGYDALFGLAGLATNDSTPLNGQTQAPVLSCNNVSDLGNVTTKSTTVDESSTDSFTKSVTDGSNNSVLGL